MNPGPDSLQEGRQTFSFSDAWYFAKYDDGPAHLNLQKTLPSKAVDFCAVSDSLRVSTLIEVKDFRGHMIENKDRVEPNTRELADEVAQKVRDSLAGVIGQSRRAKGNWQKLVRALSKEDYQFVIVLWIELDAYGKPPITIKPRLDAHTKVLKERLAWTGAKVLVLSELFPDPLIPGISAKTTG